MDRCKQTSREATGRNAPRRKIFRIKRKRTSNDDVNSPVLLPMGAITKILDFADVDVDTLLDLAKSDESIRAYVETNQIEAATLEANREILRKLRANDPELDELYLPAEEINYDNEYCPEGDRDLRWLGYFIGKNTALKELHLMISSSGPYEDLRPYNMAIGPLCRGVNLNRSIQKIWFHCGNCWTKSCVNALWDGNTLCPTFDGYVCPRCADGDSL